MRSVDKVTNPSISDVFTSCCLAVCLNLCLCTVLSLSTRARQRWITVFAIAYFQQEMYGRRGAVTRAEHILICSLVVLCSVLFSQVLVHTDTLSYFLADIATVKGK